LLNRNFLNRIDSIKGERAMDKIICVGKNYSEHVKEMARLQGDSPVAKPVLFIKPPSVLRVAPVQGSRLELRIPPDAGELHHECEIVLRISQDGYRLSLEQAAAAISDVTLGLDMTLRDRQAALKKLGQPWEISKTFLDSAAIGPWVSVREFPEYLGEEFTFTLDGVLKQRGRGSEMGMSPIECVAYLSEHFPLKAGDLVFTGTPAGVGPVKAGQVGELKWGDRVRYSVKWEPYAG
jgi:2-keto-4-pentenoate hydratase/2-oxohepta-3-ene-1,7-dioic acid hydratase in catechol pathway